MRMLAAALFVLWSGAAMAQQLVHFPSLDGNGPGQPATMLDGYLFRPPYAGRHPAVVFLHGCGGLIGRQSGRILGRERAWAGVLTGRGYAVLMVDSLNPRHHGEMCSVTGFDLALYRARPKDAYGALLWLQAQPFVIADRIAVIGWSQGGGVVLYTIGSDSLGRPAPLPQGDFRAAVAFYPGSCDPRRHPDLWTTATPLLVLSGAADVWTPAMPCRQFLDGAIGRGAPVTLQLYPGAYHEFDAPNLPIRELPQYRTRAGVVPIVGTDPAARADAFRRVPDFLARYLSP
jgi:dienelactone hydrolase